MAIDLIVILILMLIFFFLGGGEGHLNYFGIQMGPSKKISDEEEGHHLLQESTR